MNFNKCEAAIKSVTPRVLADMTKAVKSISPRELEDITKAAKNAVSGLTSIRGISSLSQFQSDLASHLPGFLEIISKTDFNSIFHAVNSAMKDIPSVSTITAGISSFYQQMNAGQLSLFDKFLPSLEHLQTLKLNYDDVIANQLERFEQITFLKPYQKRTLLDSEEKQKLNIVLDFSDFENSDIISVDVENTISFVDLLSGKADEDASVSTFSQDGKEKIDEVLSRFDKPYMDMLNGASQSALSDNPDKSRHVAVSLRELLKRLIYTLVPDAVFKQYCISKKIPHKGKPGIDKRLECFFSAVQDTHLSPLIRNDIIAIKDYLEILNNSAVHEFENNTTTKGLIYIIGKTKGIIAMLINLSKYSKLEAN